ncbi:MAG: trehalose-phosphatase [Anaerolineales bacterium]
MKDTPWREASEQLQEAVAMPRFGLFSDLDGTLSPIVQRPEDAQIKARNKELLADLSKEVSLVALISGRRAASLQSRVGLPGIIYIGNHGFERWVDGTVEVMPEVENYLPALQKAKGELQNLEEPGAYVEDKGATLSFHYRQAAEPVAFARKGAAQIAAIAEKHGLVLFTGKMVFEVRPPLDVDKGSAFRALLHDNQLDSAIFLGDDISDLNAFRVARELREQKLCAAWGVGVQSEEAPDALAGTADFMASGVEDVESLLAWVLKARRASST